MPPGYDGAGCRGEDEDDLLDSTETIRRMTEDGWTVITDAGFVGLVGPFFQRGSGTELRFGFPTEHRHHNLRGVLQGGALMTFADRVLGISARAATLAELTATVQMDVHFIDAVKIGEFVETCPTVVRATRQLIFMSTAMMVGPRIVATANGVWKKLGAPSTPKPAEAAASA